MRRRDRRCSGSSSCAVCHTQSGSRVAVIARADRLTEQAADNVLKTLEEPPPRAHLVLTSAHPEQLPQTVRSRCETVVLGPVSPAVIEAWLRRVNNVSEHDASTAAALAAGRRGRALHLATEPGALKAELDALDRFIGAGGGGAEGALRAAALVTVAAAAGAERTAEVREQALVTLGAWASFVRDAACFASGAPELAVWKAYRPALEAWAQDLDLTRIVEILAHILDTAESVAMYAQPRLAFEALMLDIFAEVGQPAAGGGGVPRVAWKSAPAAEHQESHADPQQRGGDDPRALGGDRGEALTDPGVPVVDLERILGHQSDGAGDPARALLHIFERIIVADRLWSGHPRIMGRSTMAFGGRRSWVARFKVCRQGRREGSARTKRPSRRARVAAQGGTPSAVRPVASTKAEGGAAQAPA